MALATDAERLALSPKTICTTRRSISAMTRAVVRIIRVRAPTGR